jgi:cytochrome c-type biogenesis protein CcsB
VASYVIAPLLLLAASVIPVESASTFSIEHVKYAPVQAGGRIKPFDTFARELLVDLAGKESWDGYPATSVVLSILADGDTWKQTPLLKIQHLELKERFSLERERKHFSFQELLDNQGFVAFAEELRQSGREDFDDLESAVLGAYHQMVLLDNVSRRMSPRIFPGMEEAGEWMSIGELESMSGAPFVSGVVSSWEQLQVTSLAEEEGAAVAALDGWTETITQQAGFGAVDPRKLDVEVGYNEMNPFRKAWMLYIVAFVVFLANWIVAKPGVGFVANLLLWTGFLFHSGGLLTRQYLAGRPPISNLYEALTFIVWGVVFFAIIFEMSQRRRIHGTVAAVLGSIGLVLAETMPIERELNPLVAVLRSYWMQYHVTCILLSYSALTLAAGLAHFHLAVEWFAPHRKELSAKTATLLYTSMKIGVTFLATGVILGAWWASESWGRYWGWDPKETWSLITLMGYIIVIHGRFAGWLTPYGVSVANVATWGLVLFTFYGVNFFLVGLHSYAGEADTVKIPPLLMVYLVFELIVISVGIWYTKSGRLQLRRSSAA